MAYPSFVSIPSSSSATTVNPEDPRTLVHQADEKRDTYMKMRKRVRDLRKNAKNHISANGNGNGVHVNGESLKGGMDSEAWTTLVAMVGITVLVGGTAAYVAIGLS